MPELPEVETTARGLRERIVGKRIAEAGGIDWPPMLPNAAPAMLASILPGLTVERVDRRGKYLLLGLSDDRWLAIHRKMSGNLVFDPDGAAGPPPHTHLVIRFDDSSALRFVDPRKFGRIHLFLDREKLDHFLAQRLGPEPLADLTVARLRSLVEGRRGRLKSLLLDQRFLAGIGNLYADEILWDARLHPERSAASLTLPELRRLAGAIGRVLNEAIQRRGTSFSSYRDASGQPGDNQSFLQAYGRAGLPCPRCARPIERRIIAQRGTWLCPHCQRLRPAGGSTSLSRTIPGNETGS